VSHQKSTRVEVESTDALPLETIEYVFPVPLTSRIPSEAKGDNDDFQELQINYEVLARKYNKLDVRYKEAKRQVKLLKDAIEQKTEKWRQWHEWWFSQKQLLRVKESSTSPAKLEGTMLKNLDSGIEENRSGKGRESVRDATEDNAVVTGENDELERAVRSTDDPNEVMMIQVTEFDQLPAASTIMDLAVPTHSNRVKVEDTAQFKGVNVPKVTRKIHVKTSEPGQLSHSMEMLDIQTTPLPRIVTEIPESPEVRHQDVSIIAAPIRPQSAPALHNRKNHSTPKSSVPKSAKSSGKKKGGREYPSMKYWTEDGTDGINKLPPSPTEDDEDGPSILSALLEGSSPPPIAKATPLPRPRAKTSAPTSKLPDKLSAGIKVSRGRVRDLTELESDSGSNDSAEERVKRQRGNMSEPRMHRQIVSPDLADKNKGRGRYNTSLQTR
jgi:hypothetical protein